MKVWTIQPWSVWLQIKKNGVYYANENLSQLLHPRDHLLEDEFSLSLDGRADARKNFFTS